MFDILHQNNHVLIIQTHAGEFDKWGDDLYGSFNVGLHVGDDSEQVLANRMTLLDKLNKLTNDKINQIHWLNQIHSDIVAHAGCAISPQDADAFITDKAGVGLSIMTADCVPIALFNDDCVDNENSQIACIHAGWQGLTKGIIKNTYQKFTNKTNIKAVIGACISHDNYEINKTLAHDIISQVSDKTLVALTVDELYQQIITDKDDDKCLVDIVKLTKLQLSYLNITVINDTVPCSYANLKYYSYRQQTHAKKSATGRMATVIVKL
ncbi:polyphenol oxidase family protein [Moraxella bovis]|uniref:Polyphenol oxidase family protein n=1 Tax=Moraxella bovis TaxID=476 RepID=A0AAX3EY00_MORBO|nr:polyphenol oxidase family protein [Moraxella bovis]AWY20202.1 laccase domain-containing protein [Moraxella bovis]UYZ90626.1 polyphenol oxidase family protein [Moraxella bovis]UYZ94184.1 polyphenol oxidase family protein [Moraxella bovis]UZA04384.1 polyphenol oxidase family protein [Moraxella bovis]UZA09831.1 polyphenol oxidase family protein [Moraxella bovis]